MMRAWCTGALLLCALLTACSTTGSAPAGRVVDLDLTARMQTVVLNESGLEARALTFNGTTPGPQLRLRVGDVAVIRFRNALPHPTAVHWHGIELDNANDGTPVTQNMVAPGDTFEYRFEATRPGLFWYHPHSMPTNDEFRGLYGSIIVTDAADEALVTAGILPAAEQTYVLMLADTTVCKAPGANDAATFPADPATPWAFDDSIGPFPGLTAFPSPQDLCETPRDRAGRFPARPPLAAGEIPNIMPVRDCSGGGNTFGAESQTSCRVNEGQLVLTNGYVAAGRSGTPAEPGALQGQARVYDVQAGTGVRLQLLNAAVSRYFRLQLTAADGTPIPLVRVGGEGGLLDRARIEGGMQGELDTKFAPGEIVLGTANRADTVFAVPANARPGDVLTLWTLDYQHYGTAQYPFGYGGLPTVPVAHFRVTAAPAPAQTWTLQAGDPLRMHPLVAEPNESLRAATIDMLLPPAVITG